MRTLIVDDEPLARLAVARALQTDPGFDVVGEAGDGVSAVHAIDRMRPDLVFLDIQMPDLDGFGVLEAIDDSRRPQVVFVTAYSDYAIEAFEVNAVDYVLKPFDDERIRTAARRAIGRDRGEDSDRYLGLLEAARSRPDVLHRFTVRDRGRIKFIDVRQVEWIGADGNYIRIHHAGGEDLIRMTMSAVEARAPLGVFARAHRSTIVNIAAVVDVRSRGTGDYTIRMRSDVVLTLSRSYRDSFFNVMGQGPAVG